MAAAAAPASVTLDIAADRAALPAAQAALETFLTAQGIEPPLRLRAALLVEEAFMNVVMHAFDEPAGQHVQLFATLPEGALVLRLEDHGRPFEAPGEPAAPADPTQGTLGGRGLLLIRKMADAVERERRGGVNRLTMQLRRSWL
jgi:anti-sigma regulatory factor (Ser/Thr protein kinase)